MMQSQEQRSEDVPLRRRGRPAGKNRTPLSLEERRARNAQYERERRNDAADAMSELAEAASCDPHISNAELLATVISQIQRAAKRKSSDNIENLKRINESLESQIAALENRLENEPECNDHESIKKHSLEQQTETPPDSEPPAPDPFCNHKNRNLRKYINKKQKRFKVNQDEVNEEMFSESSSELNPVELQRELRIGTSAPDDARSQDDSSLKYQVLPTDKTNTELLSNQVKPKTPNSNRKAFQSEYFHQLKPRSLSTQYEPQPIIRPQWDIQADLRAPSDQCHQEQPIDRHQLKPESQPITDLLTDREKGIIEEWMDCGDFFDIENHHNGTQVRSWPFEHFL